MSSQDRCVIVPAAPAVGSESGAHVARGHEELWAARLVGSRGLGCAQLSVQWGAGEGAIPFPGFAEFQSTPASLDRQSHAQTSTTPARWSTRSWHVSGLGFGLGPGVFEAGDDGVGVVDEFGLVVDVGGDEVAVDGEVDGGELGGVFPGVEVEGV